MEEDKKGEEKEKEEKKATGTAKKRSRIRSKTEEPARAGVEGTVFPFFGLLFSSSFIGWLAKLSLPAWSSGVGTRSESVLAESFRSTPHSVY